MNPGILMLRRHDVSLRCGLKPVKERLEQRLHLEIPRFVKLMAAF